MVTPQIWRTLVLVYRATDARWRGPASWRTRRIRRTMSSHEIEATWDVLARVPAAVASWSDGNAALEPFEVVAVDRPLATLSDSGGGRIWASPRDCRPEIDAFAPRGSHDAILIVWPTPGSLDLCGWGCSIGPGDEANGAGFSSIISDGWLSYGSQPHPEEGFVHEWLHQVEATYRSLGFGENVYPPLHDAEILTSWRPVDEPPHGDTYRVEHDRNGHTWQPWYHDYLTGRIRRPDGSGPFGLTTEVWAARGR